MRRIGVLAGAAALAGGGLTLVAAGRPAAPVVTLARLSPGMWQVHEIGTKAPPRGVCITRAEQLLQLRHPRQACERAVIAASAGAATVDYTCPGTGHGRTVLTVENPLLVRIQTQGIADGQPFDLDLEARRSGNC